MEKRKTTVIFVIGVILTVSTFLICHKHTAYQTQLDEVKLKDVVDVEKNSMFAIMVKGTDGQYKEESSFPGEGYMLNEEKSGCMDNNGEKIENSLEYDLENNKVTVSTNKTSYCYLYFDKVPQTLQTLQSQADSGLSIDLVGGMYRYQGTNVNNYICLKQIGQANCASGSNEMYRIIGITPEGNIKVMKQKSIGTKAWNAKYSVDPSTNVYCEGGDCPEWPESDLFKELNTNGNSFLSTLNEEIKGKIEPQEWWYGDIGYDYEETLIESADQTYRIETGQDAPQYYDKDYKLITDQKWKQMSDTAPIGLIYLHDYYYQANVTNCHMRLGQETYQKCINNGWMHISKNGGTTSDYEWTMSRIGLWSSSDPFYQAWFVNQFGGISDNTLKYTYAIRPVFYLTSDIELGGAGTSSDPFYIKS